MINALLINVLSRLFKKFIFLEKRNLDKALI